MSISISAAIIYGINILRTKSDLFLTLLQKRFLRLAKWICKKKKNQLCVYVFCSRSYFPYPKIYILIFFSIRRRNVENSIWIELHKLFHFLVFYILISILLPLRWNYPIFFVDKIFHHWKRIKSIWRKFSWFKCLAWSQCSYVKFLPSSIPF